MWLRRKKVNRRLGRVHVLDVKLRSDQVRQARMRWGVVALGVTLGTGFGLYVLWRAGDWALNKLVYQNPAFAIREVEVQTDGVIAAAELRRWANVKPGENLLALDLVRVKRHLELIPFIATVSVERILPKTLRLRVTEREAVAQIKSVQIRAGGGADMRIFYLDSEGYVMPPMAPRQRAKPTGLTDEMYPSLTGLNFTNLQSGRRLDSAPVAAGLRLISEFAVSPMAGLVDLQGIDVSASDVVVVTTGQGSEVTFSLNDLDRQLRRWREIYEKLPQVKTNRVALDLAVSNNIPLRLLGANTLPTPVPKVPKPLRSKKRNV
jgi:cell division septal protein FtsQ